MLEDELSSADPLDSFDAWFREAGEAGVPLPERVCLATVSADGAPAARIVLFRGIEDGRLRFYTDYRSRKARELEADPRAAMVFHWQGLRRQVRIEGTVERIPAEASDRYFASRGRGKQLTTWTSRQSAEVSDRDTLVRRRADLEERFAAKDVPRPEGWGGYGLLPALVEFWVQRDDRLHDRVVFRRTPDGWSRTRLQP
jgi:pyridoxamine 5'-phosphate oxidase